MKKKVFILGALLPLMCLSSCNRNDSIYGATTDLTKDYILYSNIDYDMRSENSYYLRQSDAYEIIDAVEHGEDALILFTSDTCHTCEEIMPTVLKDLAYLHLNIFNINQETSTNATILNEYIAKSGIQKVVTNVMNGGTPSMYLLNKKALTEVFYGSKGEKTTDVITTALKQYTSLCGIEYCVESYSNASKELYTYLLNKNNKSEVDFYYETIYPLARKTRKQIQILDVSFAKNEQKEAIIDSFNVIKDEDTNWNLDNFDGWIVSCKTVTDGHGAVGYVQSFFHYTDNDAAERITNYLNY